MNTTPPFERADLLAILPHRPPFLFVDRVTKLDPGKSIVAELPLRPEEPHFAGHFPGRPLMPGVLVTEALAQTSGLLLGLTQLLSSQAPPERPPIFFLAAANVKFTYPAQPGDLLILRADADRGFGVLSRFQVEANAGRHVVASGSLTLADAAART